MCTIRVLKNIWYPGNSSHTRQVLVAHLLLDSLCRRLQSAPLICLRDKSILKVQNRLELLSLILIILQQRQQINGPKSLIRNKLFSLFLQIVATFKMAGINLCVSYFDCLLVKVGIFGDVIQLRLFPRNVREKVLWKTQPIEGLLMICFPRKSTFLEGLNTNGPYCSHPLVLQLGLHLFHIVSLPWLVVWHTSEPAVKVVVIIAVVLVWHLGSLQALRPAAHSKVERQSCRLYL